LSEPFEDAESSAPAFPLPGQVWLQSPLMRAVGTKRFLKHTLSEVWVIKHHKGLTEGDSRIHKREEQTKECIGKPEGNW